MDITKKAAITLLSLGIFCGIAGTLAAQIHAADTTTAATNETATTETVTATSPTTAKDMPKGHAPLGGDGNITAINGTTITMQEEADEGGASYTVDASKATVTNNGATATLSALKVGDKIFVQGTTSGTSVIATSISLGHGGCRGQKPEGTSGSATK